jgi:hypothetical protein
MNRSIVGAPTSPLWGPGGWGSIICTDFCFLHAAHLYALHCLHISASFCTHLYPMYPSHLHLQPPQALLLFHLIPFCIVHTLCLAIHMLARWRDRVADSPRFFYRLPHAHFLCEVLKGDPLSSYYPKSLQVMANSSSHRLDPCVGGKYQLGKKIGSCSFGMLTSLFIPFPGTSSPFSCR